MFSSIIDDNRSKRVRQTLQLIPIGSSTDRSDRSTFCGQFEVRKTEQFGPYTRY
jgi:hypothetical protein